MVYLYLSEDKKDMATDEKVAHIAADAAERLGLTDLPENAFGIARRERGKPYFPNLQGLHFSVSHSGEVFACAFSDAPVGIDIQEKKPREGEADRCRNVAKRFFHPDEIDALDADTVRAFYAIWTAKEAYVKLTGQGIDGDFREFCIFDLDEYLFQTEYRACPLSVCAADFCDVEIIEFDL